MRIVLDCNVVIAAARTDGICRAVLVKVVRDHEVILSAPIIGNIRHFPNSRYGPVEVLRPPDFLARHR